MFICSKCDAQLLKWTGRCTECGGWGTLKETAAEIARPSTRATRRANTQAAIATPFTHISGTPSNSEPTKLSFLDVILGGGLVAGSITLLSGEPGIGKSTLTAQLALTLALAETASTVAYVTGEESPSQILRRLTRLAPNVPANVVFIQETDADAIAVYATNDQPSLLIVDSIQTITTGNVSGEPGSVSQIKACTSILAETAKMHNVRILLIGQVTKDGDIAGPRVLEHAVDTVLILEGDRGHSHRILRVLKHRFGTTDEFALLDMTERGLVTIDDPSRALLSDRPTNAPGSIVSCLIEGSRALLIEIQALTNTAGYGTPIRRATGIDAGRLGMLLAVLARHASVNVTEKDVYANAVGGFDAKDSSVDLAVCLAIASANARVPIPERTGCIGEVGLAGELRPVSHMEKRLHEFARMGFKTIVTPPLRSQKVPTGINIREAKNLQEAIALLALIKPISNDLR